MFAAGPPWPFASRKGYFLTLAWGLAKMTALSSDSENFIMNGSDPSLALRIRVMQIVAVALRRRLRDRVGHHDIPVVNQGHGMAEAGSKDHCRSSLSSPWVLPVVQIPIARSRRPGLSGSYPTTWPAASPTPNVVPPSERGLGAARSVMAPSDTFSASSRQR